jgi:hypothetical protein
MAQYGVRAAEVEQCADGRLVASPYLCPPEAEMRSPVTHAIALFEAE